MYVCLCNGVTEHDIRHAAEAGCCTLGELTMRTGCGATCGSCLPMAAELLAESSQPTQPPTGRANTATPHAYSLPQAA